MKKKVFRIIKITLLSLLSLILLTIIVFSIILSGRIGSMMSITNIGDDLYFMRYMEDYHLDKALDSNIKNEEDLLNFVCDEMFFGIRIKANLSSVSCSAFLTETEDNKNLVGRNFDFGKGSDTLSLFTKPNGGYASISSVSTDMIGVGEGSGPRTWSLKGRIALLASPYMALDGVNEKGLSASLLDMDNTNETHMETEKKDLFISLAVRLLLDKAATVDEAISLLSNYDINTSHNCTQHIFISDKSGESRVVEWYNNEMKVVKSNVCTNFRLSDESLNGDYTNQCYRFDILKNSLKNNPTNNLKESMIYLSKVKQSHTQWSVVYNLNDFTADYAVNKNYAKIYHIDAKKFKYFYSV